MPFLMFVAGLFEGVGIVLFFPLLARLQIGEETNGSAFLELFSSVLRALHMDTLTGILLLISLVFIFKFFFTFIQDIIAQRITRDLYRTVSSRIIRGWANADYRLLYLQTSTGYFMNILASVLWTFLGAFQNYGGVLVSLIFITVYLGFSVLLDWRITLSAVGAGMVVFILFRRFMTLTKQYSLRVVKEDERLQGGLVEFMQFYKYLKSTSRISTTGQYLEDIIHRATHLRFKIAIIGGFLANLPESLAVILVSLLLYVEIAFFGKEFSLIAVLILLFYRTFMRVVTLQSSWQKFLSGSGALKVIPEALEKIAKLKEQGGIIKKDKLDNAIRFHNVSFSYDTKLILSSISMEFKKNTVVALVGASGVGKSTIVDLVSGILKPTTGEIMFDRIPYQNLDVSWLRQHIGYVTQEITMFNGTIADNISFWDDRPKEDVMRRVEEQCRKAYCTDFIERLPFRYDTMVGDRGINLSVGQRQRVAIARELYRGPDIIVFDEATSALDTESEQYIQKSLDAIKGTKTIILIAHRLSTIKNADYLYVIDQGHVLEEGTFKNLYENRNSKFHQMSVSQQI